MSDLKATNHLVPCDECKAGYYLGTRYRCAVCGTLSKREQIAAVRVRLRSEMMYVEDLEVFHTVTRCGVTFATILERWDPYHGELVSDVAREGANVDNWATRANIVRCCPDFTAINPGAALDTLAERVWEAERKVRVDVERLPKRKPVILDDPDAYQNEEYRDQPAFKVGDVVALHWGEIGVVTAVSPCGYTSVRHSTGASSSKSLRARLATIPETLAAMERRGWTECDTYGKWWTTWDMGHPPTAEWLRQSLEKNLCPEEAKPYLRHLIRMMEGAA